MARVSPRSVSRASALTARRRVARVLGASLAGLLAFAGTAAADPKIVPKDEVEGAKDGDVQGWNPSLGVTGTVNFVSNSNVLGQVEGFSSLFGLGLSGGADYVHEKSVWRNRLSISESLARTPAIERFVKTNDVVDLESSYSYFARKKFGGFARVNIKTALFPAHAISAEPIMYSILSSEPGGAPVAVSSDELEVAGSFKPLALSESAGLFAEPYNAHDVAVRVRAGLGGRHTFASGVLINKDDGATPGVVEMQELADVHQAGAEVFVGVDGKARRGRVTYTAGLTALLPFANNDAFDRSATELLSVGVGAEVKFSVFDWMSVVYKTTFIKDPQLFPKGEEVNQFQNSLLLTFQFTLVEKSKAKPKESELDLAKRAKDEAEKAAAEAKAQAEEAKKRADELQRQLDEAKKAAEETQDTKPGTEPPGDAAPGTEPPGTEPPGTEPPGNEP